jgi:hypothetical protein
MNTKKVNLQKIETPPFWWLFLYNTLLQQKTLQAGAYFFCGKLYLKYSNKSERKKIMALQIITGNAPLPMPYTSQTIVLRVIIKIMEVLRSPTLLVRQACTTCGTKVMLLRPLPTNPVISIQSIFFGES